MAPRAIDLILFAGGGGPAPAERLLFAARQAAGRDLLERAAAVPGIDRRIVVTDAPDWAAGLEQYEIIADLDAPRDASTPFHFGRRLSEVIARHGVERALVMGAGSAPLLSAGDMQAALEPLRDSVPVVVTNNLHSSDWVACAPAGPLVSLAERVHRDNALAWVLAREAGFAAHVLPRTAATQFDLDTPADLALLARHPAAGPHVRAAAAGVETIPVEAALGVLRREGAQVLLAGRVSSFVWAQIESRVQVWTRVFAEERGMAASGRLARGEVRSALGALLDLLGPAGFWQRLAGLAELVILDTRVLMASRGWPAPGDRYASDLGRLEWIADDYWREFTREACAQPIPVLLGGHSLVCGGVLALLDILEDGTRGSATTVRGQMGLEIRNAPESGTPNRDA